MPNQQPDFCIEVFPRFGIADKMSSDNGPAFVHSFTDNHKGIENQTGPYKVVLATLTAIKVEGFFFIVFLLSIYIYYHIIERKAQAK